MGGDGARPREGSSRSNTTWWLEVGEGLWKGKHKGTQGFWLRNGWLVPFTGTECTGVRTGTGRGVIRLWCELAGRPGFLSQLSSSSPEGSGSPRTWGL